jgi:redox-sensitive bicupin YhaK (pirin superfamily)
MKFIPANQRYFTEISWLKSAHSFSFGQHYDPENMGFGALRVINDDWIKAQNGFPPHGHRDMEIITIVEKGILTHQDSMGNIGEVRAGDVQVMSAGTGVEHAEYNNHDEDVELFQIWLESSARNLPPRYDQKKFDLIDNAQTLLVDHLHFAADSGALGIYQQAKIWYGKYTHDHTVDFVVSPNRLAYIFNITGKLTLNDYNLSDRDALAIEEVGEYQLKISPNTKFLLFEIPQ